MKPDMLPDFGFVLGIWWAIMCIGPTIGLVVYLVREWWLNKSDQAASEKGSA